MTFTAFTALSVVSWVVRVLLGVIGRGGAVSIGVLSLLVFVKTAIVWVLGVGVSGTVVIARTSLVGCWATMRMLIVTVVLLLKHIVMLITFLHFLSFSTSVLICRLSLNRLKRCRRVLQSSVPFNRGVRLHLEDKVTVLDVGLTGVESG